MRGLDWMEVGGSVTRYRALEAVASVFCDMSAHTATVSTVVSNSRCSVP